ncbi:IS5 family transposase [Rhodococcus koreensis]|uniref:IS5 family transposase n=1 Tax=Rhodococcus koreensis TaxID=99653 RepID=UPI0036DF5149
MPISDGLLGRKSRNNRVVVEGMLYRLRTGLPWRHLPSHFGPWKTVWKRHRSSAGEGAWDRVLTALVRLPTPAGTWTGRYRSIPRSSVSISTVRTPPATQGDLPNCTNLRDEPADHGIGRSRGGLTSKEHVACDGHGRPLSVLIGPGQAGDSPMFGPLLDGISVPRLAGGASARAPTRSGPTRRTHHGPTGNYCAARASRR